MQLSFRLRSVLAALISLTAFLLAGPAAASAAPLSWQKNVVTYRDSSPYGGSVYQAAAWINALPTNLKLRPAAKHETPDIRISSAKRRASWGGFTELAYRGSRIYGVRMVLNDFWYSRKAPKSRRFTPEQRAYVTTHELLHAVGVPHMTGCSMMLPSGFYLHECADRDEPDEGTERCGPQRKDALAIVNRYGGKLGAFDGFFCPVQ